MHAEPSGAHSFWRQKSRRVQEERRDEHDRMREAGQGFLGRFLLGLAIFLLPLYTHNSPSSHRAGLRG